MTETSVIVMPAGRARRMLPRAPGRMAMPSAKVLAPAAMLGRPRRVGSRVEAMPARCTAWLKVVCAARVEHRMQWSVEASEICKPHVHQVAGAWAGITLIPRQCRKAMQTSPLRSLRAWVKGRVSSQADAALQETLSKRLCLRLPSVEEASKVCRRASKRWAEVCALNSPCAWAIVPRLWSVTDRVSWLHSP